MRKRITSVIIAIVIITTTSYCKPIMSNAMISSAGLGTYTASKVIMALLAMAGVTAKASDYELIWEGGKLNTDSIINNAMTYSRDLGMGLQMLISNTVAGQETMYIDRSLWNLWKRFCTEKYGTEIETSTTLGNVEKNVVVWGVGSKLGFGYTAVGLTASSNGTGNVEIGINEYSVIGFIYPHGKVNNKYSWYNIYLVPTTYVSAADRNKLFYSFSITTSGNNKLNGRTTELISQQAGYTYVAYIANETTGAYFSDFVYGKGFYIIPDTVTNVSSYINERILTYRQNGTLTQDISVEVSPTEGVGNEVATVAGQDVIGFNNTATQEENDDVVIEGPLSVALPAAPAMEELLKQLAEQQITYQEFVQALALRAVDTKTETKAEIEAKQQAITVNPAVGVYTVSLKDLFPFCIPFDLYDIISCFKADPVAPSAEITIPVGYNGSEFTWETYTISLSDFSPVAEVVRVLEYIAFVIGLMLITRKLIEG